MPRNNQDRLGPQVENTDPPISQSLEKPFAPPLQFVVPTEFVELPSRGQFYPDGHPLQDVGEVEIKFMTAKEEDILTDKTLLKKGIAIDRLVRSLIINKSISPDSLFVGDRNAILIAARASGYGAEYDTKIICTTCFSHGRHIFNLAEATVKHGDDFGELEVSRNEKGNIVFLVPKTKVHVECRMLTGFHEKQLIAQRQRAEKQKLPDRTTTNQLMVAIVSVNGHHEKDLIKKFVDTMPIVDSRYIRKAIEICSPDIEIHDFFECDECGAGADMEVPFTADFFWPK